MNYTELELKSKMQVLINKWKGDLPDENTPKWWRWRADKSLYYSYDQQLRKLQKT